MRFFILSLLDRRAETFGSIFMVRSLGVGVRDFGDATKQDQLKYVREFPEDFALMQVGVFDDETGELEVVRPQVVIEAADLLRREVPNGVSES